MGTLHEWLQYGPSVWHDYSERGQIRGGGLQRLVDAGRRGVTANPSLSGTVISGGEAYGAQIRAGWPR